MNTRKVMPAPCPKCSHLLSFLVFPHRLSLRLSSNSGSITKYLFIILHMAHTLPIFYDEILCSWNVSPTHNVLFHVFQRFQLTHHVFLLLRRNDFHYSNETVTKESREIPHYKNTITLCASFAPVSQQFLWENKCNVLFESPMYLQAGSQNSIFLASLLFSCGFYLRDLSYYLKIIYYICRPQ